MRERLDTLKFYNCFCENIEKAKAMCEDTEIAEEILERASQSFCVELYKAVKEKNTREKKGKVTVDLAITILGEKLPVKEDAIRNWIKDGRNRKNGREDKVVNSTTLVKEVAEAMGVPMQDLKELGVTDYISIMYIHMKMQELLHILMQNKCFLYMQEETMEFHRYCKLCARLTEYTHLHKRLIPTDTYEEIVEIIDEFGAFTERMKDGELFSFEMGEELVGELQDVLQNLEERTEWLIDAMQV
jgi:hypothetical protein